MKPGKPMSRNAKLCLDFAKAIVAGEFERAHSNVFLSNAAQKSTQFNPFEAHIALW